MTLLDRPLPPKPATFSVWGAPPGIATDFSAFKTAQGYDWHMVRPIITPRLILVHTNAASGEGTLQSQINWGNSGPFTRTHPHYAFNKPQPTKLVPSHKRGIGNSTHKDYRGLYGNVTDWSLVMETADIGSVQANISGIAWPYDCGPYLYDHMELIARAIAYESIVWGSIPLVRPVEWYSSGVAAHTDPYGYPYWTKYQGKTCPGSTKKMNFWEIILPRARQIRTAWSGKEEMYQPLDDPWRLDTRTFGSKRKLNAKETITVPRPSGVPSGARAIHVNIAVTQPEANGYITAWDEGARPNISAINYSTGATIANAINVPLTTNGSFNIYTLAKTHLILDVMGYYA